MSDPYLKNPYSSNDSEAVVESIVDMMLQTEELYSDQFNNYLRRIHRVRRNIKREQEKLKLLLAENNLSPSLPQFSKVLGDYLYPDSESEPAQTYVNPEESYTKTHTVLEVYTLKEIAAQQPGVNDAIRDSMERIYKERNMLSKLTYKFHKLNNVFGESIERKKSSSSYKDVKKKNRDIAVLISEVRSFRDVIQQIPDELAASKAKEDLNTGMNVYCSAYMVRKKQVIKDAADLSEDFSDDTSLQDTINGLLAIMSLSMPKQYTGTVENKKSILRLLDGALTDLGLLLADTIGELNLLAGSSGIPNEKVESIRRNIISVLRSQVKSKVTTKTTRDQMLAVNDSDISEKVRKKDRFVNALNRMSDAVTQGAEAMGEVAQEFSKRLFNTAVLSSGFPETFQKTGLEALKDNQREVVRQRYGGEIPFCDEVIVINDDGTKEFVKKEDATEIEDGTYRKNSDLKRNQYFDEFGRDPNDVNT
ncbi:MAG: hypothetical protein GF334_00940 [Candidatus Altiarchaeales archaeon]|nr:hypothetical protein [Candidatus Altiarchaeales archaeon]